MHSEQLSRTRLTLKPAPQRAPTQETILVTLLNKSVRLEYLSGEMVKAVLVGFDRYAIFVKFTGQEETAIIYKHAIKWISR